MKIRASDGLRALVFLCAAGPVGAQDGPAVSELWLHRGLMSVISDPETEIAPFTTDGCSGGMSGVWATVAGVSPEFLDVHGNNPPWEACCVTHDVVYHNAGGATDAETSQQARYDADRALQSCVTAAAPDQVERLGTLYGLTENDVLSLYALLAESMFHAVRIGGAPCTGLSWRWGYGFPQCSPFAQ